MTKSLTICCVALISMLVPATMFGQEIHISMTDLTTKGCGVRSAESLPSFFGPFANSTALWFSGTGFSLGSQTEVSLSSASNSTGIGKPRFLPIQITKRIDECTPGLLQGVTTQFPTSGTGTAGAIYVVRGPSGATVKPVPELFVRFELGFISSSEISVDSDGSLNEKLTVQIGRISYTYSGQDSQGRPAPVCYGWDFLTGTPWTQGCTI